MKAKGWRLTFSLIIVVLAAALVLRWMEPPEDGAEQGEAVQAMPASADLRAYFPSLPGMTYFFAGEGMEYAAFTRKVTFADSGFIQIEDLSGTNLAQVFECCRDEVRVIWSEEEFYESQSLLDAAYREERGSGTARNLIPLQAPLIPGHTWHDEGFRREILAVDETVTVPMGTFFEVVTVKSRSQAVEDFVTYEYYAKNIGLIKRVSLYVQDGETYAVASNLRSMAGPLPKL
ncbi:MAG: hypothetical protein ACOX4Y_07895 [Limnochordia bacterium]|jgi:hypothetical protein